MYISNEARIIREFSHGCDLIPIHDGMLPHIRIMTCGPMTAQTGDSALKLNSA